MSRYGILKSKKFKKHLNQRRYGCVVEQRLKARKQESNQSKGI